MPRAPLELTKKIVDLLAGVAVIFTLLFVAGQWYEMRKGGADTAALANAAKAQAEAAKLLAESAKSQADNTATLAKAALQQVEKLDAGVKETHALAAATKRSADAARNTAETTARQLELSERPWVKIVDVKTRGEGPVIPALSFQQLPQDNQQATFQLTVSLKNIGHSVADVAVRYELLVPKERGFVILRLAALPRKNQTISRSSSYSRKKRLTGRVGPPES